jgi:hypothetical protein
MSAFTAAALEHDLVAKELRRHRRNPTEELFRVSFVFLGEVLPLPTETRGCRTLVALNLLEICETWNTGSYRKGNRASRTAQRTFHNLSIFAMRDGKV